MSLDELRAELHLIDSKPKGPLSSVQESVAKVTGQQTYREQLVSLIALREEQCRNEDNRHGYSAMEALVLVELLYDKSKNARNGLEFLACELLGLNFTSNQANELKYAKQAADRDYERYKSAVESVKRRLHSGITQKTSYPKAIEDFLSGE